MPKPNHGELYIWRVFSYRSGMKILINTFDMKISFGYTSHHQLLGRGKSCSYVGTWRRKKSRKSKNRPAYWRFGNQSLRGDFDSGKYSGEYFVKSNLIPPLYLRSHKEIALTTERYAEENLCEGEYHCNWKNYQRFISICATREPIY